MNKRDFIKTAVINTSAALACISAFAGSSIAMAARVISFSQRYLRPPGALAEAEFLSRCIRCNQCAEVCPNNCIKFFGSENGLESHGTPYITPREKACILCMKCGDVCPTGAIQVIEHKQEPIIAKVKMGVARIDQQLCLSWQGKSCGVCYRACPLQDVAIKVGFMEQPSITEACVGCGLCESSCIQIPQAVKVIPEHTLKVQGASSEV